MLSFKTTVKEEKSLRKQIIDKRRKIDIALFDMLKQEGCDKYDLEKLQAQSAFNKRLDEDLEVLVIRSKHLEREYLTLKAESNVKVKK